jgi:hypothetical protein
MGSLRAIGELAPNGLGLPLIHGDRGARDVVVGRRRLGARVGLDANANLNRRRI